MATNNKYANTVENQFNSLLDDYIDGMNFHSFSYNDPTALKPETEQYFSAIEAQKHNSDYANFSAPENGKAGPNNYTGISPMDKQNNPVNQKLAIPSAQVTGGEGEAQARSNGPLNNYNAEFIRKSNTAAHRDEGSAIGPDSTVSNYVRSLNASEDMEEASPLDKIRAFNASSASRVTDYYNALCSFGEQLENYGYEDGYDDDYEDDDEDYEEYDDEYEGNDEDDEEYYDEPIYPTLLDDPNFSEKLNWYESETGNF